MHDVLIVGAGAAGLGTAYYLRDLKLDVCVLEAAADAGGRSRTVPLAGTSANSGAMFIYRDTKTEEIASELGLETTPFHPETYGIHVNGSTVVAQTNENLVAGLNLDASERAELKEFIDASLKEYAESTSNGVLRSDLAQLADETVADRLRGLQPAVRDIVATAIRGGAVGDPMRLSAKYALRYFASYLAREKNNRLFALAGMQAIPRAIMEHLPEGVVRFSTRVNDVAYLPNQNAHRVSVSGPGGEETLWARQVVLTVPAPLVPRLAKGLPAWKINALGKVGTPGSTTLNVVADIEGLPHLHNWAFITTVGMPFDAIINPVPGGTAYTSKANLLQLTCYGNSAGFQPGFEQDEARVGEWVEAVLAVAPELKGRIVGVHAQTWEHCFALLEPERAAALPQLQESVGSLHFAGDYTSETAGTHGAYAEADRVASHIRASLAAAS
ncbi:flavin monoamine oxidase family protein [Pseudarthrobacter sp. NPDC058119]|uniref:flavin monoamine oxidase family protein n=1 Tax=Pseudarthrobacter sp. NPDC058119 TaxID=3346348 RepID=UPI0036D76A8C